MEGILLVLCSYIDNMPYVVAEAAVSLPSPALDIHRRALMEQVCLL